MLINTFEPSGNVFMISVCHSAVLCLPSVPSLNLLNIFRVPYKGGMLSRFTTENLRLKIKFVTTKVPLHGQTKEFSYVITYAEKTFFYAVPKLLQKSGYIISLSVCFNYFTQVKHNQMYNHNLGTQHRCVQ